MDFNVVDDYVTAKIFSFVPLNYRITIESVCKRWRTLLYSSYRNIKSLCLYEHMCPERFKVCQKRENVLEALLRRCGKHLKLLKLAHMHNYRTVQSFTAKFELTEKMLQLIAKHCEHLLVLDLNHHYFASAQALEKLAEISPTLRELYIENCRLDVVTTDHNTSCSTAEIVLIIDKILIKIFTPFSTLETISFRGSCYGYFIVTDTALAHLPASLRVLDVSAGYAAKICNLSFLSKMPSIRQLFLERTAITDADLQLLCSIAPQLTHLALSYAKSLTDFSPLSQLAQLSNLQLNGNRHNLMDNAFTAICMSCLNLASLSIESCSSLTVASLRCIRLLKNLRCLSVSGVAEFEDHSLKLICLECSQLKGLQLKYCRKITANGLQYLRQLRQLQVLRVNGLKHFDRSLQQQLITKLTKLTVIEAFDCGDKGLGLQPIST